MMLTDFMNRFAKLQFNKSEQATMNASMVSGSFSISGIDLGCHR